jgi:hypothetical protein
LLRERRAEARQACLDHAEPTHISALRHQLGEVSVEVGDLIGEFGSQIGHLRIEAFDLIATQEPDAGLGVRQRHALPDRLHAAPDRRHGTERRVLGVDQLLAGGEILALCAEGLGGEGLLGRRQALADAEPGKRQSGRRHRRPETLRWGRVRVRQQRRVSERGHGNSFEMKRSRLKPREATQLQTMAELLKEAIRNSGKTGNAIAIEFGTPQPVLYGSWPDSAI